MTTIDTKGREFEVAREVTDLLDTLEPTQRTQILALMYERYGFKPVRFVRSRAPSPAKRPYAKKR